MSQSNRVANFSPTLVLWDSPFSPTYDRDGRTHARKVFNHRRLRDTLAATPPAFWEVDHIDWYPTFFDVVHSSPMQTHGNGVQAWDRLGEHRDTAFARCRRH